jgi:hypothetical protein
LNATERGGLAVLEVEVSWEGWKSLPRSTEVVAVVRETGRWKGLELVSEAAVGVVEDMDQLRALSERAGCATGSGWSAVLRCWRVEVRDMVRWCLSRVLPSS